jgi:hypothetical protein
MLSAMKSYLSYSLREGPNQTPGRALLATEKWARGMVFSLKTGSFGNLADFQ